MASSLDHDIKAPDGFLLGGLRRVRADGTILFQRGWWSAPKEWAGKSVWVHDADGGIEAAPPGVHIYTAQSKGSAVFCERTERGDAKPGYRKPAHKAWHERVSK
jgi:hypothetical protein